MPVELSDLATILAGLASGTLTVPVVSWVLYQLPQRADKNQKRAIAVALSFVLAIGAYVALVFAGVKPTPESVWGWVDALWPVATGAFTASQVILSAYKAWVAKLPGNEF